MSKTAMWVVGLLVALGAGFLLGGAGPSLTRFVEVANSLAALATAGALVVGFRSLGFQREAFAAQREELTLQRQEMKESREELAKTVEAQRELADAQRKTVEAQHRANFVGAAALIAEIQTFLMTHAEVTNFPKFTERQRLCLFNPTNEKRQAVNLPFHLTYLGDPSAKRRRSRSVRTRFRAGHGAGAPRHAHFATPARIELALPA